MNSVAGVAHRVHTLQRRFNTLCSIRIKKMENQIKNLEIQNFKSIKHLQMECKRVNIFIGEPNVGKSNILEALSLLGAGFETNYEKFLSSFVRYENFRDIFYDKDLTKDIQVITDNFWGLIHYHHNNMNTCSFVISGKKSLKTEIQNLIVKENVSLKDIENELQRLYLNTDITPMYRYIFQNGAANQNLLNFSAPIRKYDFKHLADYSNKFPSFLLPPFGDNLLSILYQNKTLFKEVGSFFGKYGFRLGIDLDENKLKIQKSVDEFSFIHFPYSSMADTLQRIIFYLTAIESNKNSVLLFEEPEAHSFPPYVGMLADRIAQDEDNQYFIATHSPLLLDSIIEGTAKEDRNIVITYFKDYETKIKVLSEVEIKEFLNDKIDLFYNINRFIDDYVSPFAD